MFSYAGRITLIATAIGVALTALFKLTYPNVGVQNMLGLTALISVILAVAIERIFATRSADDSAASSRAVSRKRAGRRKRG